MSGVHDCPYCGAHIDELEISHHNALILSRLREWTQTYGADLCPGYHADTFGEGMRAAKEMVKRMLDKTD